MVDINEIIATYSTPLDSDRFGTHLVEILPVTTVTIPPYTTTNAIFFGSKNFWVIDPGSPFADEQQRLKVYITHRMANHGGHFAGVLLTHHHDDHVEAATFLAREFSVPILAHPAAERFLDFPFQPLAHDEVITSAGETALRAWPRAKSCFTCACNHFIMRKRLKRKIQKALGGWMRQNRHRKFPR